MIAVNQFRYTLIVNSISIFDFNHNVNIFEREAFFNTVMLLDIYPTLCYTFVRFFDNLSNATTVYRKKCFFLVKDCNTFFFLSEIYFFFSVIPSTNLSRRLYSKLLHRKPSRESTIYPPDQKFLRYHH